MDPRHWERACAVFEAARGLEGDARDALLEASPDVADDVRELLHHHEAAHGPLGDGARAAAGPSVGDELGAYRLDAHLGDGGMASVFRATGPQGVVALKLLHPELAGEPVVIERLRREGELGMRIAHPNVVRTLGFASETALVLELVEGRTLAAILEADGAFDERRTRHLAAAILTGLVGVHEHGAVHRDLKPSNVMVREDGHVLLMDLGIALPLDDLMRLSQTGQFIGTVRHAAPEQLTHDKAQVDPRTDLYALGLLLYEVLAGRHPHPPGGFVSTMRAHLEHEPERLDTVMPSVSTELATLVRSLLEKRPEARPPSAQAVLVALDALPPA